MNPVDMDITPEDYLLVSDAGNNRFQILDQDGGVKLVGGEFGTKNFQIQSIAGCGVHRISGDIAICDLKGNKIVRYDKSGRPKQKVTQSVRGPLDVAFDKLGNLYVIMARKPAVYKYDQIGNLVATIGGAGQSAFLFPISLRIKDDFIFVADSAAKRVVKLKMNGDFVTQYDKKGEFEPMKGPSSVFIDNIGYVFALDVGDVPLALLDPEGKLFSKIGGFGEGPGQFMYPRSLVALENGDVFVLDSNKNVIIKYKKTG